MTAEDFDRAGYCQECPHSGLCECSCHDDQRTKHVVMFSGGIGSWATAARVAEKHGTDNLVLLFADTLVEDEDTYRFLNEAAVQVGGELVKVADGRTPFEVFHDDHFLGNSRLANCSKYLKIKPCREWLEANCDPDDTVLYVGIDWTETHRLPAITAGWLPYQVVAPLTEPPLRDKLGMVKAARRAGLEPPAAYDSGYPHANCLSQGCVRGGQAYWQLLLRDRPEVYAKTEAEEAGIRETEWGKDAAMLRSRVGGESTPMTLKEFREMLERQPSLFDEDEWGGCGCFTDQPAA